jgi:ABC-type ATPase with predicted acetyltransferase domain
MHVYREKTKTYGYIRQKTIVEELLELLVELLPAMAIITFGIFILYLLSYGYTILSATEITTIETAIVTTVVTKQSNQPRLPDCNSDDELEKVIEYLTNYLEKKKHKTSTFFTTITTPKNFGCMPLGNREINNSELMKMFLKKNKKIKKLKKEIADMKKSQIDYENKKEKLEIILLRLKIVVASIATIAGTSGAIKLFSITFIEKKSEPDITTETAENKPTITQNTPIPVQSYSM